MDNIVQNLKEVIWFIDKNPKLAGTADLEALTERLDKALNNYLNKTRDIVITTMKGYPEAYALLEGDGKAIANKLFMHDFAKKYFNESFEPENANAKTRKMFLKLAAKNNKLSKLMTELDPNKKYREKFLELIKLDLKEIQSSIVGMKPTLRKNFLDANGIDYYKTPTGKFSTGPPPPPPPPPQAMNYIMSQITDMKSSECFYK